MSEIKMLSLSLILYTGFGVSPGADWLAVRRIEGTTGRITAATGTACERDGNSTNAG